MITAAIFAPAEPIGTSSAPIVLGQRGAGTPAAGCGWPRSGSARRSRRVGGSGGYGGGWSVREHPVLGRQRDRAGGQAARAGAVRRSRARRAPPSRCGPPRRTRGCRRAGRRSRPGRRRQPVGVARRPPGSRRPPRTAPRRPGASGPARSTQQLVGEPCRRRPCSAAGSAYPSSSRSPQQQLAGAAGEPAREGADR